MSSYGNITTRIIDSVFDRANLRVEFRLPADNLYLSNMRLVGLGIFSSNAGSSYNELLGALGGVKNISVFDGSTLLEQMNRAEILNAFKAQQRVNDENLSVNRELKHNALGFNVQGEYAITAGQVDDNNIQLVEQNPQTNNVNERAWLSLKDHLSFFRSSMTIPTNVFRQFRIVVEYITSGAMAQATSVNNATLSTGLSATGAPNVLLLVDEMNDGEMKEQMKRNYNGVVYRPIENDSVQIPAITGLANTASDQEKEQQNSFLVNGFNNKRLVRLLAVNTPNDSTTFTNGNDNTNLGGKGSTSQHKQTFQVRVNGKNKIAGGGIEASATGSVGNRRLAHLVDSWGNANIIQGGNITCYGQDLATTPPKVVSTAVQAYIGNQDYVGVHIDERIQELQVFTNRAGLFGNTDTSQSLTLNLFGEVEKAVVMRGNGEYNVVYA